MAIKLSFGRKKEEESYYEDPYYGDSFSAKPEPELEVSNIEMTEMAEEETAAPEKNFSGINESAVSLKVMAPKNYAEATKVADSLIAGSTVVLNVEALENAEMIRFMDFLMGVLYVIHGNMKNVSKTTIVVSPSGISDESESSVEE